MEAVTISSTFRDFARNGLGIPLLLLLMLAMMILPLPPIVLDLLFSFNISFALVVLLTGIYVKKPLDFGIFPTILLVATLLRLALNIASTRVVLLNGHTGTDAAGQVVQAFGEVVIGGNYAVGLVVFAILVIINFVVVTKGAGRISEVTARFTLDAMPGKQMAIDADLNAGLLTADEAKTRREEVGEEADFYGAMDGASKFVRGDAVAGILILFINLIGGLIIGTLQNGMSISDAMHNYALLTIGDGLVAQIPSLVLSTAAAMMVTRVSRSQDMGGQVIAQLFSNPNVLMIAAAVISVLGLIPGMPHLSFLILGTLLATAAYYVAQKKQKQAMITADEAEQQQQEEVKTDQPEQEELSWDDVSSVDRIGLEVGYRLIPLVDDKQGGQLMKRIKGVRKKLSQDLGFLVPAVHICDNLDLPPNGYRIILLGVCAGEGEIYIDQDLAINPGQVMGKLDGVPTKDPAFGLDAVWINTALREHAQSMGYTVVDSSTVVATHLSQLLHEHAAEMLGHEEVQKMVDRLAEASPKLVEALTPNPLPLSVIVKVLQNLLQEKIPLRDIHTITEALAECAHKSQDPDVLTQVVRLAMGAFIIQNVNGVAEEVPVITLHPDLEQILQQSLQTSIESGSYTMEPGLASRLQQALAQSVQRQELAGQASILLVPSNLRLMLAKFTRYSVNGLHVLSYQEIPDNKIIKVIASVGNESQ